MAMFSLSSAAVSTAVVALVAAVVLYDGYRLRRMRAEVPMLGELRNGGWAWESDSEYEVIRNGTSLLTLGIMMALPWLLAESSETPTSAVLVFDLLLGLHCLWLMVPKRYAVTQTHLFADGFQYSWDGLRSTGWSGGSRLVLQRKGWWLFAPLPVGGALSDLEQASARIEALQSGEWALFVTDEQE